MAEAPRPLTAHAAVPREAHEYRSVSPAALREEEIDLWHYAGVFQRHWVLLAALAVIGAVGGFGLSRLRPVVYEAVTTLVVLSPASGDGSPANAASFRALLLNYSLAATVVRDTGLDKPPDELTSQRFLERALTVHQVAGTNLVRVSVRAADPVRAADASRRLSEGAVALNERIGAGVSTSVRDRMKAHLDEATGRLQTAEGRLLAFQREAQVDLLEKEADAILDERGELLKLSISIEGEKARLTAAEQEIKRQDRILSIERSPRAEEALRRAAREPEQRPTERRPQSTDERRRAADSEERRRAAEVETREAIVDPEMLDLSNPFVNPVYQTLDLQIATSRSRLAALERRRAELLEVRKLGGAELPQLSELYRRKVELARLEAAHDLAKKVYTDMAVRYEEARTDVLNRSAQLQVVDPAIPPERPVGRKGAQSIALGMVVGLMFAGLAVLVLEHRQRTL